MKVAVIGAGYVGLTTAACLASLGHDVVCADIDAERVARLSGGDIPIREEGPAPARRRRPRRAPALVRRRRRQGGSGRRARVPVRADAAGRRRRGRPVLRRGRGARDRSRAGVGRGRRQQVDDAGRLDASGAADPRRVGRRARPGHRRVEPRVPARGRGRPRLPQPRSHRDRVRRSGRGRAHLRSLPRGARAGARHRPGVGRDDQVRVERVPRDEDLVHQRDREPVRGGRRRRARGRARHGLRQAHRLRVPAPRTRLRRFVLPEGHRGAALHRGAGRVRLRAAQRRARRQPRAARAHGRQDRARRRAATSTACASRSGASRSRPTPTTCATRRRS